MLKMVLVVFEKCSSRIPYNAFVPDNYMLIKLLRNILAQVNPIKTTIALWVLACIRFYACLGCVVAVSNRIFVPDNYMLIEFAITLQD